MKKICLIIPYFGKLPNYFNFWLKSCEYNKSIDWLLVTDNNINNLPNNIKLLNTSFSDLVSYIQKRFDFNLNIQTPYKLCDFKPCYGYIFKDFLNEYDFWGHCDMDLIWGDIRSFLPDDVLNSYDRIFDQGHLSIYRNNNIVNSWFKTLPPVSSKYTYQIILSSQLNYAFDEEGGKTSWGGINQMVRNMNLKQYNKMCFDDVSFTQKNFYSRRPIKGLEDKTRKEKIHFPMFFKFNKGRLYRVVKIGNSFDISETLYAHFQKRDLLIQTNNLNEYSIVPNKFIDSNISDNKLANLSRYRFFYLKPFIIRLKNLKRKILFILK